MDHALVARIYEHLEADHVEKAVMSCLRIARQLNDYMNAAIFIRELYPNKNEVARVLYDDVSHLNEDTLKFIWQKSLDQWISLHTLDFDIVGKKQTADSSDDSPRFLMVSAGELEGELKQLEGAIADMTLPTGMHPVDTAMFMDSFTHSKAEIRLRIKALLTIKARIKSRCLNYAIRIERQILRQKKTQNFLVDVQSYVNNYFSARDENVYDKLQKASQLVTSTESEDAALLLTEIRRSLNAAANFFYPPLDHDEICSDGIKRKMGNDQYLNRLQEFIITKIKKSAARDLLAEELNYMISFIRRLNDIASKGVHGSVTLGEAKQGLIGLYFFLFNVCQQLEEADRGAAVTGEP